MENVFKGCISSLRDKILRSKIALVLLAIAVVFSASAVSAVVVPPTLLSIAITTPATKLSYVVGDVLDISGLVVTGTYKDGKNLIDQTETITTDNVGGFNSSVPVVGQVLTITVNGKTTTYTVDIVAPTLDSIAITTPATKLSYAIGESLNIDGLVVTGTYSNGTTKVETITTGNITGFDSSVAIVGQTLTITVDGKTATYAVNINAPSEPSNGGSGGGGGSSSVSGSNMGGALLGSGNIGGGVVLGAETFNFANDLRLGASGDDVKELQKRLAEEGLYTGAINGTFDDATLQAVKAYQKKHGLPQTGFVGPLTRAELNKEQTPEDNSALVQKLSKMIEILQQILKLQTQLASL